MSKSKHLGSRLSITSTQLKNATLQLNSGEELGSDPSTNTDSSLQAGHTVAPAGQESSPPVGPGTEEANETDVLVPSGDIHGEEAYLLMSIAGTIEQITPKDWQSLRTFLNTQYKLSGKTLGDVVKLTPENHEFLKKIKFTYDMDMSLFVNMMLELFRGRFYHQLPKLPCKITNPK